MTTLRAEVRRSSKTRVWWKRACTIILVIALTISIFALPTKIVKAKSNQSSFRIDYHLTLEKEDYPTVEVKVTNAPSHTSEFIFGLVPGGTLGVVGDLHKIFEDIKVTDKDGNNLYWYWRVNNKIIVKNNTCTNFVIKYYIDALNIKRSNEIGISAQRFAFFRKKRIFFIVGDVFLIPKIKPSSITVSFSLPKGVRMFSSLPEKNGKFIATTDLWGSILYDFQKAYFTGGYPIFSLTHYTKWGDKYIYIWFDRDPGFEAWDPSYGNTPWEQAEKYMETTEMFAKYYRDVAVGPLPLHTVLFTNVIPSSKKSPPVATNTDWFHYMQIWPRYSEPEICHHVFHQYSFSISQSKLSFNPAKPIGYFLAEGLNTYFEQVFPTLLLNDNHYEGKLFEFFALDQRGKKNGIRDNYFHNVYNISAMKVYLLDQYIQRVTDGKKSLVDFTKEMWNEVKNNTGPKEFQEKDIINAFTKIVGKSHKNYISQLAIQNAFNKEDFLPLLPDFQAYMDWMSKEYFWKNKLLFLVFLDIVSAEGKEWPHYATYPHNVLWNRREALTPFKNYLEKLNKSTLTEEDIIDAMNSVTGGDHSGFFEFWKSYGIKLDPNSLLPLDKWKLLKYDESTYVSGTWGSVGVLKTEYYLASIPQKGEAILDKSDNDGQIVIEVRLQSFKNYPPIKEAKNALSGRNVSFIYSSQDKDKNLFLTRAFFKVATNDSEYKKFDFNLILPSFLSHPKFVVYDYPLQGNGSLGTLYWLHSIDPIDFKITVDGNTIKLPDTALKNEKFTIEFDDKKINASANDTIKIPADTNVKISLLDEFGFLRGYKEVEIDTIPPKIVISSPANNSTIDTSKVSISGTVTDDESGVDKVTVNGNDVSVSSDGAFRTTVNLKEGTNTITIIAEDKTGNKASKTITATYEKPVQAIIITLQPDNPYMTVNGVQQEIDPGRGTKPVIIKEWGRTVVPIRAIVEALGGTISWNGTERKVTIDFKGTTIELWIDGPQAEVNGVMKWIDPKNHNVKPIIINDRTMLPLRFVAESLGCTVDWNGATKTITIIYGG